MSAQNKTPLYVEDLLAILDQSQARGYATNHGGGGDVFVTHKALVASLKKLVAVPATKQEGAKP